MSEKGLEVISNDNLISFLSELESIVYKNEKLFLETFFEPEYGKGWSDLVEFSISSEKCILSVLLFDGPTVLTSVGIVNVLNWSRSLS